ncbi:UDP-glucuronic acid decarboxylase 6 [Hibiscus syriacus]|uniref:UDP-glucuronic acid decarboxylase 1 n=1 Tax=Hibiscus syriacus TaxID=106335 RepID=A0A6A2Y999_HIBSY|nr:UDP-glucuronic acid decarboxylase 6 [Hibiscus syriacus]
MATDSSNGERQTTTKPPPLPSPLRFSKFFQANMRILVTGGGFIGSHLVDKLMENEKNEFDVTQPFFVEVDRIYHLACPASPIFYKYNPVKTIKTSVIGTLNILGLAKRVGARILLTSTSEVYGDPLTHPQLETYWGNANPIDRISSVEDILILIGVGRMFNVMKALLREIRIARIFNTYGPRMNIDVGRVVSNFIAQALRGEPLTVQKPGWQTRSFCYVSDMVPETFDGLIRLMEGKNTGLINIGNPGEFTMLELAETVKELINPKVPVLHMLQLINPKVEINMVENTTGDPRQRQPDITMAKELLDWVPRVTLRDGIPLMEEDFRLKLWLSKE